MSCSVRSNRQFIFTVLVKQWSSNQQPASCETGCFVHLSACIPLSACSCHCRGYAVAFWCMPGSLNVLNYELCFVCGLPVVVLCAAVHLAHCARPDDVGAGQWCQGCWTKVQQWLGDACASEPAAQSARLQEQWHILCTWHFVHLAGFRV